MDTLDLDKLCRQLQKTWYPFEMRSLSSSVMYKDCCGKMWRDKNAEKPSCSNLWKPANYPPVVFCISILSHFYSYVPDLRRFVTFQDQVLRRFAIGSGLAGIFEEHHKRQPKGRLHIAHLLLFSFYFLFQKSDFRRKARRRPTTMTFENCIFLSCILSVFVTSLKPKPFCKDPLGKYNSHRNRAGETKDGDANGH